MLTDSHAATKQNKHRTSSGLQKQGLQKNSHWCSSVQPPGLLTPQGSGNRQIKSLQTLHTLDRTPSNLYPLAGATVLRAKLPDTHAVALTNSWPVVIASLQLLLLLSFFLHSVSCILNKNSVTTFPHKELCSDCCKHLHLYMLFSFMLSLYCLYGPLSICNGLYTVLEK